MSSNIKRQQQEIATQDSTPTRTIELKSLPNEAVPPRDSALDSGISQDSSGFDVFLNFRGPDSRHTVADVLYDTLINAGFRVFLDNEEIRKGEEIEGELLRAITNSRIYIPIFSKDYASSRWCLRELAKMIDCWQHSSGQAKKVILPIFYDVSVSEDVKLRSHMYTSALQKHKKELGEVIVKPWEDALRKVARIKGWNLQDHGLSELANLIKKRVLSDINANEAVSSVPDRLVGIHDKMEDIMQLLDDGTPDVRFIVIHGMGGIGKTTLANAVFRNISSHFQGSCILKDVRRSSSDSDIVKLQEKLLLDTLNLKSIEVTDIDDGISNISRRLCNKKVLLVLDDVDKRDHLLNLAAKSNWFGPKSRIIITTRNISCLPTKDNKEYCFYEMKEMDPDLALQLFCRYAFEIEHPPPEYRDISLQIVDTTGGLPLALRAIGCSLYNQDKETWNFGLDKLEEAPHENVQEKLMISYQALNYEQQQIFLDIACFFNDRDTMDPTYFWEACELYPDSMIKALVHRSLIKVDGSGKLWMHDQLIDLGRAIAQPPKTQDCENRISAKPSRLWSPEVALDVVQKKEVTESIVALDLGILDDGYCLGPEEFVKAINLKFLRLTRGNFKGNFKNAFHQLRWLSWSDGPLKIKATNLSFTNLVVMKLSWFSITEDWSGWGAIMKAKQLRVMHLIACVFPTKTPKFSSRLALERLIFKRCLLKEIDGSIGNLKHLDYLEIEGRNLTPEPRVLPASIGGLKSLTTLKVIRTRVTELHPSLGELTLLVELVICEPEIKEIPDTIGNLRRLKILKINCGLIVFLPGSIGRLEELSEFNLESDRITQLPETIRNLKKLKFINLDTMCLKEFPKALGELENLEELHATESWLLDGELPEEIGRLAHLRVLDLGRCKITRVPVSIKQLFNLHELHLSLDRTQELPKLPTSLTVLSVLFVSEESPRLPDLSYLTNLVSLSLTSLLGFIHSLQAMRPHVDTTRIDWLTRLQKLEDVELTCLSSIFPPIDLSSLHRLQRLSITCFDPRSLTHLPSSLETLRLFVVKSPIDQILADFNNLSSLELHKCCLEEITLGPGHLRYLHLNDCESVVRLSNLSCLKELRKLMIETCPNIVDIQGLGELDFLQSLTMSSCYSIQRLPNLSRSKKLEDMAFHYCGSLKSIPDINEEAPCRLSVRSCDNLADFSGPYSDYSDSGFPGSCGVGDNVL